MKVKVIRPDGSLVFFPAIAAIAESEDQSLILLHSDGSERGFAPGEWVGLEAAKPAVKPASERA